MALAGHGAGAIVKLARCSLYAVALSLVSASALFLAVPNTLTTTVGIPLPTPIALMEIRGVYGGFFSGTGLFFLLFARNDVWLRPGLVAQASIMSGLVLGRLLGIDVDGPPSSYIAVLLAVEVVAVVVAVAALRQLDRSTAL